MPQKIAHNNRIIAIHPAEQSAQAAVPLFHAMVPAGFPSPAEDHLDLPLDLNQYLVKHPAATFYVRVKGHSMTDAGIDDGDILVVDRAEQCRNKSVVLAVINGEYTVKRIIEKDGVIYLVPNNPNFTQMKIDYEMDFAVWGVITYVIHRPS